MITQRNGYHHKQTSSFGVIDGDGGGDKVNKLARTPR
jgi:hypothetical protein